MATAHRARRRQQGLRRLRRARPGRGHPGHRGRPGDGDHGPVGRRQVHAAQPDRRPGPTHPGQIMLDGVRVDRLDEAASAPLPAPEGRARLPVVPPARRAVRARQRGRAGSAGRHRPRSRGQTRAWSSWVSSGWRHEAQALPGHAQRRPAPARRDRPRGGQPTGRAARRRAHGVARQPERRDRARAPRGPEPARPDDRDRDPRPAPGSSAWRTARATWSTAVIADDAAVARAA